MKSCCLASLVVVALAVVTNAQSAQRSDVVPPTYAGASIGASFHFDRLTQRTTHTVTLKFGPPDDPEFTVDYVFTYPGMRMSRPTVVDEVITKEVLGRVQTQLSTSLGGDWTPTPFPIRLTSRTAFTRSMPVDYFSTLVQSPVVRERVMGAELVFSELQLQMLRQQTVDQWK